MCKGNACSHCHCQLPQRCSGMLVGIEVRNRSGKKPQVCCRSHCLIGKIKFESKDRVSYKSIFL